MVRVSSAIVLVESLTGNTWKAGEKIAVNLQQQGWDVSSVCSVRRPELDALGAADLVIVGTWTDGLLVVGQRPGNKGRINGLPTMFGKRAAGYCTYAINPGKVPDKLSAILRGRGADVIGGLALHRNKLDQHAEEFVSRLLANVTA